MARIKSEAIHQAEQRKRQLEAKLKAGTDATSVDKKKRRKLKKSRARALRKQMRELQSRSSHMVPRATMQRLIRQIGDEVSGEGSAPRWTVEAIEEIQGGAEAYLHDLFSSAYQLSTRVGGRQTLRPEELRHVAAQQENAKERYSGRAD